MTYKKFVRSLFVEDTLQDALKHKATFSHGERKTLHYVIQINDGARDLVLPDLAETSS